MKKSNVKNVKCLVYPLILVLMTFGLLVNTTYATKSNLDLHKNNQMRLQMKFKTQFVLRLLEAGANLLEDPELSNLFAQESMERQLQRDEELQDLLFNEDVDTKEKRLNVFNQLNDQLVLPKGLLPQLINNLIPEIRGKWDFDLKQFKRIPFLSENFLANGLSKKIDLSGLRSIENLKNSFNAEKIPSVIHLFLKEVLDQYYAESLPVYKNKWLSGLVNFLAYERFNNKVVEINWRKEVAALLQSSGPALQKLFQLMTEHMDDEDLKKEINTLKENVTPFQDMLAERIISEYVPGLERGSLTSEKRVGSATIGQVYIFDNPLVEQKVIAKVKRPNIDNFSMEEMALIRNIASKENFANTAVKDVVNDLEEGIKEELDFHNEYSNLKSSYDLGYYRDKEKHIDQIRPLENLYPYEDRVEGYNHLLFLEVAPGISVNKYLTMVGNIFEQPDIDEQTKVARYIAYTTVTQQIQYFTHIRKDEYHSIILEFSELRKRYQDLIEMWLFRAIFKGEFHPDLHPGNVFFEYEPKIHNRPNRDGIEDVGRWSKFSSEMIIYDDESMSYRNDILGKQKLTLIDFGSLPKFEKQMRVALVNLVVYLGFIKDKKQINTKEQDKINKEFYKLVGQIIDQDIDNIDKFNKKGLIIFNELNRLPKAEKSPGAIFSNILNILLQNNIKYNNKLTQFVRGLAMLEGTYNKIEDMKTNMIKAFETEESLSNFRDSLYELTEGQRFENPSWNISKAWKRALRKGIQKYGLPSKSFGPKSFLDIKSKQKLPELDLLDQTQTRNERYTRNLLKRMNTKKQ